MGPARVTFRVLSYLFLIAVAIQFFLAGLSVLGGESIEAHRQWGFIVMHLIPIAMFLVAILGKMGRVTIAMVVVLFVLIFLQPLFADESLDPQWLRSFHVFDALLIAFLGYHISERASGRIQVRS
ncbi:MAG TPA: DUF6220 domain-containing protein [Dehalococcoidia bacterium]